MGNNGQSTMSHTKPPSTSKRLTIPIVVVLVFDTVVSVYLYRSGQFDRKFVVPFSILLFVFTLLPIAYVLFSQSSVQVSLSERTFRRLRFFTSSLFAMGIVPILAGLSVILFYPVRERQFVAFFSTLVIGHTLHWGTKAIMKWRKTGGVPNGNADVHP